MAVPKKKMSKSRTKRRKAMHKISKPHFVIDPETGVAKQSHRVNPVDGTYNGRKAKEPTNESLITYEYNCNRCNGRRFCSQRDR
mgnify:CR=1 FL=1